jgi:hypothetical protein
LCSSARNRRKCFGKGWLCTTKCSSVWVTGLSGGAPDSVRCARTRLGEKFALGTRRRRTAINHRTVRWCTRLSGESSAAKSLLSGNNQRRTAKIHRTVRWCTGLSGEANARLRQRSATQSARDAWASQRSAGGTRLSGVHRTVCGVPTAARLQRLDAPEKEGDHAPDSYRDCPVAHRTVRCTTRQKASIAFQECLQRLLAALGL